jgi:hypothetical protein
MSCEAHYSLSSLKCMYTHIHRIVLFPVNCDVKYMLLLGGELWQLSCETLMCMKNVHNIVCYNSIKLSYSHAKSKTYITSICKAYLLLQKKRIMIGLNPRSTCRPLFKNLRILTVSSQHTVFNESLVNNISFNNIIQTKFTSKNVSPCATNKFIVKRFWRWFIIRSIIIVDFFHRLATKFKRLKSHVSKTGSAFVIRWKMVGSTGVINLFCWVILIELVPTVGPHDVMETKM